MKNKRIILVILVIAAVVAMACVTVYAVVKGNDKPENDDAPPMILNLSEYIRDGVPSEIVTTLADGDRVFLTYKCTDDDPVGGYTDVYLDEEGREYEFDEKGKFVGTFLSSADHIKLIRGEIKSDHKKLESAKSLEEVARDYAKKFYGDAIDGFTLVDKSTEDSGYSFVFAPVYGEDGFILGETCFVDIFFDGTLINCFSPWFGDFDDVDYDYLKDIKKSDMYKYAEDSLMEKYGDRLKSCETTGVSLRNVDGECKIRMGVSIVLSTDFGTRVEDLPQAEDVYYDLPSSK